MERGIEPSKELFEWYMKWTRTKDYSPEELFGYIECFKLAIMIKAIQKEKKC
jgi:hypothetical protein